MTASDFVQLCEKLTISPAIALENEAIKKALHDRNDGIVKQILETEF